VDAFVEGDAIPPTLHSSGSRLRVSERVFELLSSNTVAVWAHHMFVTGKVDLPFFSGMTFLIAVPALEGWDESSRTAACADVQRA
jgi:hypothetical protein